MITSVFDVEVLLEVRRDVARGKLSRVAIFLAGVRLKPQLPTLIQVAWALVWEEGRRDHIAGQAQGRN